MNLPEFHMGIDPGWLPMNPNYFVVKTQVPGFWLMEMDDSSMDGVGFS
jgi:hypothetical protein